MKLTFSKKAEEFKPGIFTQLNEKRKNFWLRAEKFITFPWEPRISGRRRTL